MTQIVVLTTDGSLLSKTYDKENREFTSMQIAGLNQIEGLGEGRVRFDSKFKILVE